MQSIITPRPQRDKKIMLLLLGFFISSISFAQFSVSCTSKDLELVSARIGDANSCVSCTPGSEVTKDLILAIYNKTGSFRPAFAFWGYLVQKDANDQPIGQPVLIHGCSDAGIAENTTTEVLFPAELTYTCGNKLEIVDLVMAWTDAGKKSDCANLTADPSKINPKCGRVPVVPVNAGLNISGGVTNGTCSNGVPSKGSINVSTNGGVPPYTFAWTGPGEYTASTEDISNLNAGLYTITVTDNNSPQCQKTASFNVNVPTGINASAVPTVGVCTAGSPTNGSIALTVTSGTASSFEWTATNGGSLTSAQADDEDLFNLPAGTYAVKVNSADGCYKNIANIGITVPVGINANAVPTVGVCTAGSPTNGSIALTVTTGTASSFEWTATVGGPIPAGQSDDEDLSNLPAGTYAVKVNSADGCYKNIASIVITVPAGIDASAVPTNGTCGTNGVPINGSIAVTVTSGTASSFAWSASSGGSIPLGKSADEDQSNLAAGNYSVLVTNASGCFKSIPGIAITVPTVPNAATICKIEPGLCGPAAGIINVLTPTGNGYEYSKNGGTNWQTSTSFTNLAAGSSPSIMVKNSAGCWSTATVCTSASICAPAEKSISQTVTEVDNIRPLGSGELEAALTVKAMPNPFSNQVRFLIKSAYSGIGSLDIYNLQGQKVKNVYSGYIRAGSSYFDLRIADNTNTSQLIYVLSINGERVTGKLLRTTR